MSRFLQTLSKNVLVADGAIGTILYSEGIDTCPEAYNLTHPKKIEQIHRSYIEAGADVIQTNTYGANFEKLQAFGLEHQVRDITRAGVRIAKQAANEDTFILGTVGGFKGVKQNDLSLSTILYHTDLQIETLIDEGVDALLYGTEINEALKQVEAEGADVIGLNCHHGPHHMQQSFTHIEIPQHAILSCYPNASLLDFEDSTIHYSDNASYFGKIAETLVKEGVHLIGGCCGTTPEHIRFIKQAVEGLKPTLEKKVIPIRRKSNYPSIPVKKNNLTTKVKAGPTVIVELDTPKHLDTTKFFANVTKLDKAKVDAITLADNSLATVRVSNIAAASIIKQNYNIEPLVHITCRDRNLIGLQSHLLGLSLLGINEILAITGDPSKVGHLPGATNVYDVNSRGLTELAVRFNQGLNIDGGALKTKTNFNISGAFNPNVRKMEAAVKRLDKKVDCGMSYFITQPVYTVERIQEIAEKTAHLDTPFFIGIMPITSYRNATFLHNEVPGISLPDEILDQFEAVKDDKQKTKELSLRICRKLIDEVIKHFNGLYIITPFEQVDFSLELTHYFKKQTAKNQEAII